MSSPPKVIIVSLNITYKVKNAQLYYSLLLHIVIALLKYRQKYYLERVAGACPVEPGTLRVFNWGLPSSVALCAQPKADLTGEPLNPEPVYMFN